MSNTVMYSDFEIPKNTNKYVKKVLRNLAKYDVITYTYDDGPSKIIGLELKEVLEAIGIEVISKNYKLILIKSPNVLDGAKFEFDDKDIL